MTDAYDNRSFLSGIAVGRQLKGWSAGGDAGGGGSSVPDTYDGGYTLVNAPLIVSFAATWEGYLVPAPIVCTWEAV